MIRMVVAIVFAAVVIVLVLPWFMLWTALTGNGDAMYAASMRATRTIGKILGLRAHVEGLGNIPSGPCVFVSNHASNIDPVALFPSVPRRLSVLAKKELFRVPILGWGMKQVKFVPIDRSNSKSGIASAERAAAFLRQGLSFVIFAEATRSPDGRLQSFRKGAFAMAIQAGVPIVPVALSGTHKRLPKGRFGIIPGDVTVRFAKPVDASKYSMNHRAELLAAVHAAVVQNLPAGQQPRGGNASEDNPSADDSRTI